MSRKSNIYGQSSRRTPSCGGSRIPRRSSSTPSIPYVLGAPPSTDVRGGLLQSLRRRRSSSSSCMDRHSMGRPSIAGSKRPAVKDPRPLNEREYQRECAERLHEFLSSHGFTPQMTVQQILRMSNKQYMECFQFLMKFLDPEFTLGGKVEEGVMDALLFFGYPFSISKSMLQTIGSRAPLALGTLTWLLELVMYSEQTDILKHVFQDDGAPGTAENLPLRQLVEFGFRAKNLSEEQKDPFLQKLVEDTHGPLQSLDELQQELAHCESEVIRRQGDVAAYDTIVEEIAKTKASTEQVELFIQQMDECYKTRLQQLEAIKAEADAKELEAEELKKELQVLQATLDEQKQRGEDQQSLKEEQERIKAEIQQVRRLVLADVQKRQNIEVELRTLLEKNQNENNQLNELYDELRRLCTHPSLPGSTRLKEFHYTLTTSPEDLQEIRNLCGDISEAAIHQLSKLAANTEKEKEMTESYRSDIQEMEKECKLEEELLDQAMASHEALMQDLLAQDEKEKEEYASLMKQTVDAESRIRALQSKDSLLQLQKRVSAAEENSLDQCRKYEEIKAEQEKRMKDVEEVMKEWDARILQNFRRLQELVEEHSEFKRNFKAPWSKDTS